VSHEGGTPGETPAYAGAVLVGGRGRRFGGDKCAHPYRGRSLLEHALDAMVDAQERWLVGGAPRDVAGTRWIPDERSGFGALGGVHAALRHAVTPWLAVTACDMPFLPAALWPALLSRSDGARLVVPEGPTGLEPLAAVYHRDLMPAIDALLARGGGPLRGLLDAAPSRVVPWRELRAHLPGSAFLNANRPEDLP
jgi:molybdopterin-guanine dinucleotide biosynthesis protein A